LKNHNTSAICPSQVNPLEIKKISSFDVNKYINYKHGKARAFNTVVSLTNQYEEIHASQKTIGKFAGDYSRQWENHLLNDLNKDGAIKLTKRAIDETLITDLPDELFFYENRKILSKKYPAFAICTPIVRRRAIQGRLKNLTQLSSYSLYIKDTCSINIKDLENGAAFSVPYNKNKLFSKKGNAKAEICDATTKHSVRKESLYPRKKTNRNRVYGSKKGTKHFNTWLHFDCSEEKYDAERSEYIESIRYKSKLDDPNYDPMSEVHQVQTAIYERVKQDYKAKYAIKHEDPTYDPCQITFEINKSIKLRRKLADDEREKKRWAWHAEQDRLLALKDKKREQDNQCSAVNLLNRPLWLKELLKDLGQLDLEE